MVRCEPRVSCINIKKISKIKNILQFGVEQTLEREKEEGEKKQTSPVILLGFAPSKFGRPRVKAALHDKSYAWVPESQDFAKVQGSGFLGNREKMMSREITLFEVGFFSYSI